MGRLSAEAADEEQGQRRPPSDFSVALISLPFASAIRPSLQLGLLGAIGRRHGFQVTTHHLNLEFAAQIGLDLYEALCEHRGRLVGDWLFSLEAFQADAPDSDDRLLDDFDDLLGPSEGTVDRLRRLRHDDVPRFLDHILGLERWERYDVVAFTSTFQQSVASFAMARRLKEQSKDILTLFGGANFEDPMGEEYVRSVEAIDYAIAGEADLAFPELLAALQADSDAALVPGVICRRDGKVVNEPARPPFERMDDLPTPSYDEYFERAERLGLLSIGPRRAVQLPFESARGCWWGAKRHCTFCGLNGTVMSYRAKTPSRVLAEITELTSRYRSFELEAVDNILEPSYLEGVFQTLAANNSDFRFFYEVKANLTRDDLRTLHLGGVSRIQPGIESLSSHVLGLMRKGVRASQNVNVLRWANYYGIDVGWNLLYGFPLETTADYEQQARLMPALVHLQPPLAAGRIWMERFSPIFMDREAFPARFVRAEASYGYVYPKQFQLEELAYFFDYELYDTLPDDAYQDLHSAVDSWISAWRGEPSPTLTYWSAPGFLIIEDERDPSAPGAHTFTDPLASIYLSCSERPIIAARVCKALGLAATASEVEEVLDEFCARGLMMRDGNLFLSLAIPATTGR